jgi:putative ABC transport system substrate-binding protein
MKRREFITLLGGAAATWPIGAAAQQPATHPLIGVLSPLSSAAAARSIGALRAGLRDLGYIDGRNVTLVVRYGEGVPERMGSLAAELVALKPDVLFVGSKSGVLAVHNATRTIPIVTIVPEDPVTIGIAASIARPGGNVTGTWLLGDDALVGKRLEFLRLAVPSISRVGFLFNPDDPTDAVLVPRLPAAAAGLGLMIQPFELRDIALIDAIATQIASSGVQALFVSQGPTLNSRRVDIAAMVARLRLPAVYGFREFAESGGLMSYGPNLPDIYRQSARLLDRILKGANPADLPIELPTRFELIVNLKTAKALGLTIAESFMLLADDVIE